MIYWVLYFLSYEAPRPRNYCEVSYRELAEEMQLSVGSVHRAMQVMIRSKILCRHTQGTGKNKSIYLVGRYMETLTDDGSYEGSWAIPYSIVDYS